MYNFGLWSLTIYIVHIEVNIIIYTHRVFSCGSRISLVFLYGPITSLAAFSNLVSTSGNVDHAANKAYLMKMH